MTAQERADPRRDELMHLMRAGLAAGRPTVAPIGRRADGAVPPMTDEQKHVWLDAARAPDAPLYNEPITIHYRGPYDHAVFLRSFDELLRRHEALRVSFASLEDDPVQIVHNDVRADFRLVDLTGLPPGRREEEALAIARTDAMRPFDLERPPLFRGLVLRHDERDHRLHLTLHHIIFDGVTIYRTLVPELASIHAAYAAGRDHDLPDPGPRYGDYAVWQRAQADTDARRAQLAYWVDRMAGHPPLDLPADRPRRAVPTNAGSMRTFELDADLVAALRGDAKAEGATLYMALLAGLKALLARYAGQEDIVVGGVTDTRRRPEIQRMAGYCLNVVPLRSRVGADMTFRQLLAEVRTTVVAALENSDVPYERIVREVRQRDGGRRDLFNVFFSIEPPAPAFAEGWDLTQMDVAPRTAKYDLYFELDERPDGMAGRILYGTDLFDADTIDRMIGHWTCMLRQVAADPGIALRDLRLMDDAEAAAVDIAGRGPIVAIPDTTIPSLVRVAGLARPGHAAIVHDGRAITHAELARRVDGLASTIRDAGVARGDVVALCCDRSPDMIAAALAIMDVGAVYLPLDPAFPKARLDAIVADARPRLVVTERPLEGDLSRWGIPTLACDAVDPRRGEDGHAAPPADAGDIAYLMYTSGSTGVPKGVEIEHRSAVNLLASMRREPGFCADDVLLAVTTPTFDISILEMFLPLVCGGTVAIAARDDVPDPARLAGLIDATGCTLMQATPSLWRSLLANGWRGRPGMRVLCGGEALPADLARALLDRGLELWNMYGPTETTIWSSTLRVVDPAVLSIGRPIGNTRFVVLGRDGEPQPVNVPGALHIGGAGLARGYRDDALTGAAFAVAPRAGGERLYRTGDQAVMRRDGTFEWLGRQDGQVKVRGHRIDVGDIEAAIAAFPAVHAAAVRTYPATDGDAALVACVQMTAGAILDPARMREHLRDVLPAYMVPARFVQVATMPLTANGKIDRKALPTRSETEAPTASTPVCPPTGDVQRGLAAIWSDLLGVRGIGADDDFHELGGHSLLAARMMGRIAAQFGRRLPLSVLLRAPTLRALAAVIEDVAPAAASPASVVIGGDRRGRTIYWIDAVPNLRPATFRAMAAALPRGYRLVGLTMDLDRHGELRATTSLAEIARDMARTIRLDPSARPYLLGGWCNGGVLAHEVACQLADAGDPAALLVMLDAANPATHRGRAARIRVHVRQLHALHGAARWRFARDTAGGYLGRLRRRALAATTGEDGIEELNHRFMRLVGAHDPRPYAGRTVLLLPREGRLDCGSGWRPVATGPFAVDEVAGGHVTVLEKPHVEHLSRTLAAHVGEASVGRGPAPEADDPLHASRAMLDSVQARMVSGQPASYPALLK